MDLEADNLTRRTKAQGPPPRIAGITFGPGLAGALYTLLVGSAIFALIVRRSPGEVPRSLESAAPWVFLAFLALFGIYRFALVQALRYPAFKAFFQIGVGVIFFTLLLPSAKIPYQGSPANPEPVHPSAVSDRDLGPLFSDPNPVVRSLVAELAAHRSEGKKYVPALIGALEDPQIEVRRKAHQSLVALTGKDLGVPEDPSSVGAWRRAFR